MQRRDGEALYAAKDVVGSIGQAVEPAVPPVSAPAAGRTSRLAVTNRACAFLPAYFRALRAHDVDGAMEHISDRITHDDRRGFGGVLLMGPDAMGQAIQGVVEQYTQFDHRVLAVRGEDSLLRKTRWSDDDGNETNHLIVNQVDDDGRVFYHGMFDEDDFEGAYQELERRYYAGEGAAFEEGGALGTEVVVATNRGDLDRVYGELTTPGSRFENRCRSVFPDRSIEEYRASVEELDAMVVSARVWHSAICWLSPTCCVFRGEREAEGVDGEEYAWTWIYAGEARDGRITSLCQFDLDDEDAAFTYAEGLARTTASRLAVTNRASETLHGVGRMMNAHDVDGLVGCWADQFVYDDRRGLSGDPITESAGMRVAAERFFEQYFHFEGRTLAVRGERLTLGWTRWSDDAGNETVQLSVDEVGDDGRIAREVRFDEDDFEGAYRELERRYYAGEGAAFADGGATVTDVMVGLNRGDLERVFRELVAPEMRVDKMRVDNRSLSAFPNRAASILRASFAELDAMVASVRTWLSVVRWIAPVSGAARFDRVAVGRDGEQYAWDSCCRARGSCRTRHLGVRVRTQRRGSRLRLCRGAGAGNL